MPAGHAAGMAQVVSVPADAFAGKWRSIATLIACELLAMAVWFASAAVLPALRAERALDPLFAAMLTSAVQVGFVIGTLTSATLGLADRTDPRLLFRLSAIVAGLASLASAALAPDSALLIALRLVTGICMAGVYPVGMKIASSWARADTGLLIGGLVGALTIGSASPHLIAALGGVDWRLTYVAAGALAIAAGLGTFLMRLGPGMTKAPPFDPRAVLHAWTDRPLRLANLGYLGHMWELYAMWAWIGLFVQASFAAQMGEAQATLWGRVATFAVIAVGGIGCVAGGLFADRLGRTTLTMLAMAVSGLCALVVGFTFGGAPALVLIVCAVWGVSIVADSAQFSASIAELADRSYVGTMLTVQTAQGFLLTLVTIHLLPYAVDWLGWRWAFATLAIGPLLGVVAMARLRADPASKRLAGGRR
jgi:MFS family permease